MEASPRDQNHVPALILESSTNAGVVITAKGIQATGRLLVDSSGGGAGTVTEVDTGAGLTGGPITTTGTIALDSKLAPLDTLGSPGQLIRVNAGATALEYFTSSGGGVSSVVGTSNRISVDSTDPANPIVNIAATYVGQSSITTLGTIATGVWQGTKVGLAYGGTNADLSATGGTSQVLKQVSSGAVVTVGQLAASDLSNGTTGSGAVVLAGSPALTGSPTAPTQTPADNSTKVATTAYVDAAVLGQNFKEAALVATTANLVGVYLSNVFTYTATGTDNIDGVNLALGNRVLVKNQTTTFQNGIYTVTTAGSLGVAGVLTRSSDANTSGEFKTGDSIFVTSGTANSATTWAYTGADSPTLGTDAITYAQVAGQGSFTAGNGIAITGNSIAIDTSVTVDKTTSQTLTNKTLTSPTLTTPTLGVASATTINKVTLTAPATGSTLTILDGKTATFNKSITLDAANDGNTFTFPNGSQGIAGLSANQTFTGQDKFNNIIDVNNAVTVTSNAGTVPVTFRLNTFTNSSAATMAITLATASAVDGQMTIVRIYDFSAVVQTIGWTNTENSTVSAPLLSNGSTTLPLTVGLQFNGATSKWRILAVA